MRENSIYGTVMVAGSIALIATGMFHPTGTQLLASAEAAQSVGLRNTIVHAVALTGLWLTLFGLVGFSRHLGIRRPDVTAALVAFAMASCAVMIAAITDGILIPKLARDYFMVDEATRAMLMQLMRYSGLAASSMTRFYISSVAVSILLWSWAISRTQFSRVLPWVGIAVALPALIAQLLGHLQMNVHDVLVLALGQSVWMVWTGIALVRKPTPATSIDR
jgi:hypothetical protein